MYNFFFLHSVHTILCKNIKYDMLVYYFKHKQRKCIVGLKDHVSKVPLLYREPPRSLILPVVGGTVRFILCEPIDAKGTDRFNTLHVCL